MAIFNCPKCGRRCVFAGDISNTPPEHYPICSPECPGLKRKCNRKACQAELTDKHIAIWNDFNSNEPKLYCSPCGTRIILGNENDDIKLKFECRES